MIFKLLFVIFLAGSAWAETEKTANDTQALITGNMCEVCSCKDGIVNCNSRGLEDHFADEHWPNETLIVVSFARNKFVHVRAFPNVVVNRLILRENNITSIDNGAFMELRNLMALDLSHNQLTTPLLGPRVFRGPFSPAAYNPLDEMKSLDLSYNTLHSLHQDLFQHIQDLKILSLEGNPFGVIDYTTTVAIGSLPYLEELNLSYCDLRDLPEHLFRRLQRLKIVNLSGNKFTSPPQTLEEGKAIEWLVLDNNPIEFINEINGFPIMKNLKILSLLCMPNVSRIEVRVFLRGHLLKFHRNKGCPPLGRNLRERSAPKGYTERIA